MDPMPQIFTIIAEASTTKKISNASIRTKGFPLFISYFLKKIIFLTFILHSTLVTLKRQQRLHSNYFPRQKTLFLTAIMTMQNSKAGSL
jgi:hypothetical protein